MSESSTGWYYIAAVVSLAAIAITIRQDMYWHALVFGVFLFLSVSGIVSAGRKQERRQWNAAYREIPIPRAALDSLIHGYIRTHHPEIDSLHAYGPRMHEYAEGDTTQFEMVIVIPRR